MLFKFNVLQKFSFLVAAGKISSTIKINTANIVDSGEELNEWY